MADVKTVFEDLDLPAEIMRAIADLEFQYCTPIQATVLPDTLSGADASGRAQTGTGKTAAFLITIFSRLLRNPLSEKRRRGTPRALIIAPTRELALQIEKDARSLGKYCPFKVITIFGGMDYRKQKRALTEEVIDVVVATPGRLLDFKRRHDVHLSRVEIMVIDEADRMLDMGFIPDVRRIIHSTPPKTKRQTMLFGATLTPEVTRLAGQWTRDPVTVDIEPEQVAGEDIDQIVYITTARDKLALLYNLVTQEKLERVLVFTNRRDTTRRLTKDLQRYGLNSGLLSGEVDQKERIKTLERFREGEIRVLVATDVAGRGLHVEGISHVVNYNLPHSPEDYVHRIGRTGRAGATGTSVSFACEYDSFQLPGIEELLGHELPCQRPPEDWLTLPPPQDQGGRDSHPRRSDDDRRRRPSRRGRGRRRE